MCAQKLAAGLLALLCALVCFNETYAANPPILRSIVDDLTSSLIGELQQANISLLLVLPGPLNHNGIRLKWHKVAEAVERMTFVPDMQHFLQHWHGIHRYHRWHEAHGTSSKHTRKSLPSAAPEGTRLLYNSDDGAVSIDDEFADIHPIVNPTPPKVALLLLAKDGAIRSNQSNLAAAVSRRLRHTHALTFTYSTQVDKGDTLLVFDADGSPLRANFLATTIFRDAFSAIYDKKEWGTGGGGSGHGSDLEWTADIRKALPNIIQKYGINSMLDSSCGSMHWMPLVVRQVQAANEDFKFMGTDVVCSLINRHKVTFAAERNWNFECVDYSNQQLPSGYDLVFSRDSLQHIPLHGTWQFLNNVKVSGAKFLLVGSYIRSMSGNTDIKAGQYYDINLLNTPFKLSPPLEIIDEHTQDEKHMLLFDVRNMTWEDPLLGLA